MRRLATSIAAAVLAVAALAPGREADAAVNAFVLAPAVMLAASLAAAVRAARGPARPPRVLLTGDAALVHAPLAGRNRAHLAILLDLDESVVAAALIERELRDAAQRRRANALLGQQLELAAAQIEAEDIASIGTIIAPDDVPADDPEVAALIAQAEAVLREDRSRRAFAAERLML